MFIEYEHEQMHNSLSSWTGWSLEDRDDLQVICLWKHCMQADQLLSRACPQQKNKFNSGVFICQVIEHLSRGAKFDFAQQDMPFLCQRMIYKLANGLLIETLV